MVSFSILSRFGHHRRSASERERARSRRWRLDETASPRRRHHDHTRVSASWEGPDGVRATQVGCGTSMNASLYGAKLMRDLGAFDTAQVMDASEVDAPDLPVKNGGVLAVSQSGETKDVLRSVTQRPFPTGSELQLWEDGVLMTASFPQVRPEGHGPRRDGPVRRELRR